ncbi:uncharacterized protein LOC126681467 [Mercurialis annua]|uniref:uncharacterized protein LOC126681467 n=1 Tax=Mercurialis annua TaxID=3986 RepID=UPI00215FBC9C|nr:uncharacterized protein LOC126681467 [Mercurialis annua]
MATRRRRNGGGRTMRRSDNCVKAIILDVDGLNSDFYVQMDGLNSNLCKTILDGGRNSHDCHMIPAKLVHLTNRVSSPPYGDPHAHAVNLSLIDGIHVYSYAEPISILQYANDTLLFVSNDIAMVQNLLRILCFFELISGLQTNFNKSAIIRLNVDDVSLAATSNILSCKLYSLPIMYLRLPLSSKSVSLSLWELIVSNVSTQLAAWKDNLLSPGSRLILIKSVLSSLPLYYLCSFLFPHSVITTLEHFKRRFLWSGSGDHMGFSKVAWADVCVPIDNGGLNILPLRFRNQ